MPTPLATPDLTEPEPFPAPKSNVGLILLAILCAGFAVPQEDDREVGLPLRKWQFHATYLDGVAMALAKYKDVHGHFPDNNQGLQSLDTFGSRFETLMEPRRSELAPPDPDPAKFFSRHTDRYFWEMIRNQIRECRAQTGRFPQNGDELPFPPFYGNYLASGDRLRRVQVAISENDCLYLLGPNCMFDPSLTPYGYENRTGLDGKLFADSIANSDPTHKFSRELAPGVYVYSYNARDYYQTYRNKLFARRARIFIPGGLAAGLLVIAAYRSRKYGLRKAPLVFPALAALLGLGVSASIRTTCYIFSSMPRRNPEDLAAQKRLLEQFRSSGVITPETYGKAMQAFETDAVFVPSKEPKPGGEEPEAPP